MTAPPTVSPPVPPVPPFVWTGHCYRTHGVELHPYGTGWVVWHTLEEVEEPAGDDPRKAMLDILAGKYA